MIKLVFLFIIVFLLACAPSKTYKKKSYILPSKRNGIYYSIKQGDSLWKISNQYNLSVEKIMRDNNISSPYNLKVGQKLFIPRYSSASNKDFLWPLKGNIINYFNENVDNTLNRGINIQTIVTNRDIKASQQGKVTFSNPLKGWGKTIILKHNSNFYTVYANLNQASAKEGSNVSKGEIIGTVASGRDGNYILHFEVRKKNIPQDPLKYLN